MTLYILLATLFLLTRDSLMYSNLTLISSNNLYKIPVIIHIIISTLYYRQSLLKINKKINHLPHIVSIIIHIISIMMISGAFVPYMHPGDDLLSHIHVYLCMISSLLFLIILYIYNNCIYRYYMNIYRKTHYFFETGLSFLCLVIVAFGHINGYIEFIYCTLVTIYINMLKKEFHII